ncbi:phage portal protein [uncultured Thermomonospora sp.]|uniref:phage portal protein n=1 Tax=uncultured Thermomonospora sp. TaxID=671175 RepID=UPI00259BA62E|nr:phage portal protein [uncultured Thermomonospora sp.]
MALSVEQAVDTAKRLLEIREGEQRRLNKIAAYMRGRQDSVYVPRGAQQEYRWLIKRAKVNVLPLVVTVVAQALFVEGYRPEKASQNAKAWEYWQANRMDARQHGLHRAVLKYGVAYAVVLPGRLDGRPMPVITPKSPRRMTAYYEDPVEDEWPIYAVEVKKENLPNGKCRKVVRLYDDEARYSLVTDEDDKGLLQPAEPEWVAEHNLGVCPVVRYLNGDDLDGDEEVIGEVEPLFDMQDQLNSTTFGRMMAEQFAAFRQRYVSGMVIEGEEGRPKAPFAAAVDRLWVAEDPDTRFGEFEQTDLSGYLRSAEETIRHIATVSQTPPHHLLGQMTNLSADALNSARDGLNSKVAEKQSVFGESHEQMLRLASLAAGDRDGWLDTAAQVVWRDTQSRSLAQTVDALGKLVQMLQVPPQVLWERIPGVTQQDVKRWLAAAAQADPMAQLNAMVERQMNGLPAVDTVPAEQEEPAELAGVTGDDTA